MMEIYVLVPVRKRMICTLVGILSFVLALTSFLMACAIPVFFFLAVLFAVAGYWFMFQTNKEFEYSYFDGEVRFAKVVNKSRRKKLAVYTMEDVISIAPEEDRSVYKYLHDTAIKIKDYSSHVKGAACYVMVINQGGQMQVIRFEPDEKYLNAVTMKYAQKVIRRKES